MNDELTPEDKEALKHVASKLEFYEKQRGNLIPILQMVQETVAYLPAQAIKIVSQHLGIFETEVYGVATFYNQFRFHPPGKHPIKVCLGTACHVRGGDIILENFERKLGICAGETTPDREFSVDRVACVGCCALAPVAVIDETV
ncbi:MAG: NAD(P)H-dependent oxidoreductase subunit E, partial [Desulfobacterales bacterium]